MQANQTIRKLASAKGVKMWQIADAIGMWDTAFSRKLRHELPEQEQQKIMEIIEQIATGGVESFKTKKSAPSIDAPDREKMNEQPFPKARNVQTYSAILPEGLQGRMALKPKEAAPLMGVGVNTIYELCHREDFPSIRMGGGYIIPVDALQHWLCAQAGTMTK
jgi:excisionase family DNA binding protein